MRKKISGYTLLELCIVIMIIGIASSTAISSVWQSVPTVEAKEGLRTIEQILQLAKSTAIKQSQTIVVDLSQAKTNHSNQGGLIEIENNTGTVINTYYLNKNVLVDDSSTTDDQIRFDFRGQPVDSSGSASTITTDNNTIAVTYNKGSGSLALKSLTISPVTGNIELTN